MEVMGLDHTVLNKSTLHQRLPSCSSNIFRDDDAQLVARATEMNGYEIASTECVR